MVEQIQKKGIFVVVQRYGHTIFPVFELGVKMAQEANGNQRGAYYIEILQAIEGELKALKGKGVPSVLYFPSFADMIIRDKVFFNTDCTLFSLIPLPGYTTFSQDLATRMPGHVWNHDFFRLDQGSAPSLSFAHLVKLWLSPAADVSLSSEVQQYEGALKERGDMFLDGAPIPRVFLASFMRSGNTMVKNLIEETSGVTTGSDQIGLQPLVLSLLLQGFKGEAVTDCRTWIGKTHFPYYLPDQVRQSASKALLVVRNPIDVIVSNIHFCMTQTQNKSYANDFEKEFPKEWDYCVKFYTRKWKDYYQYWINMAKEKKIPVYFIRFEDCVENNARTLREIYPYLLGVESIEGSYMDQRIRSIVEDAKHELVYKPREQKHKSTLEKLAPAYQTFVQKICKDLLHFFGYSVIDGQENPTGLFHYEEVSAEDRENYYGFRKLNAEQKAWYLSHKEEIDSNEMAVHTGSDRPEIPITEEPHVKMNDIRYKFKILE